MLGALPAPPSAPSMQRRKICMWGEAESVLGTFGSRLGVGTEVKSGPVVSCSLSSVTVHVHWYAMGGVPAVAQVFLLSYDTITSLQIRRCEPRWSASPETVRDFGP